MRFLLITKNSFSTSDLLQKISDQEKFERKKLKIFNITKPTNSTFKRTKYRKGAKSLKLF